MKTMSPRSFTLACTLLASALVAAPAEAREFRVNEIPNGPKRGCFNCHRDGGGSSFNDFGSDARTSLEGDTVASEKHVNWQKFYMRDSDGDGYTNGQELGDPNGTWMPGMPNPTGEITNPGDDKSFPKPVCNNGKLDPGESCEGTMLSKPDCAAASAGNGKLACTATCKFDYSDCSIIPPGAEDDDGGELNPMDDGCSSGAHGARASTHGLFAALGALVVLGARRRRRA